MNASESTEYGTNEEPLDAETLASRLFSVVMAGVMATILLMVVASGW